MTNDYSKQKQEMLYEMAAGIAYVDAYLRYSSANQDDGISIEMQQDDINAYCANNGLMVRKWYIDRATSASKKAAATREAFYDLIQDINSGDTAGTVLIYSTSRAFRNSYESHKYRKFFRDKKITLISATQHIDEGTSSGRLTTSILSDIDQYKAEELSDYVKSAIRALAKRGFYTGNAVPFGYTTVPAFDEAGKPRKKYAVIESEAEAVRDIFRYYVGGALPRFIADRINEKGFRTRRGNLFTPDAIRKLIMNDFYIGTRRIQLKDQEELIIHGAVNAIVDDATFAAAQQMRESRKRCRAPVSKWKKNNYLLTGKVLCKICTEREGEPRYMIGKASSTYRYGKRYEYCSYVCNGKEKYKICNCKKIKKNDLEEYVLREVKKHILDESLIDNIAAEVLQEVKTRPAPTGDEKALAKRKKEIVAALVNLAKMKADCKIDDEIYTISKKEYDDEKALIDIDLHMIEQAKKQSVDYDYIAEEIRGMIADIESGDADLIKAAFEKTVDRVEIDNDKVTVYLVIHFTPFAHKRALCSSKYAISANAARDNLSR